MSVNQQHVGSLSLRCPYFLKCFVSFHAVSGNLLLVLGSRIVAQMSGGWLFEYFKLVALFLLKLNNFAFRMETYFHCFHSIAAIFFSSTSFYYL